MSLPESERDDMVAESKSEGRVTIIQHYRRHGRAIVIPCYLVALPLVVACFFVRTRLLQLVLATSVAVLIIGALIAMTRFACPRCGKPMGLVSKAPSSRRMTGKPAVCHHCGVDFQEPC